MNFCRPARVYPAAPFWKKKPLLSLLLHSPFIWVIDPGAEISKCIRGKLRHSRRCRMVGGRRRLRGNDNQMPTGRNTTGRKGKLVRRTAFFSGCVKRMYFQAISTKADESFCVGVSELIPDWLRSTLSFIHLCKSFCHSLSRPSLPCPNSFMDTLSGAGL